MPSKIERINDADKAWHWTCGCQWREWVTRGWNWRNFDFIAIQVEYDRVSGRSVELYVALLGLHITVEWCNRMERARFMAEMDQRMARAKEWIDTDDEGSATDGK